jgi:hypothetical protein
MDQCYFICPDDAQIQLQFMSQKRNKDAECQQYTDMQTRLATTSTSSTTSTTSKATTLVSSTTLKSKATSTVSSTVSSKTTPMSTPSSPIATLRSSLAPFIRPPQIWPLISVLYILLRHM